VQEFRRKTAMKGIGQTEKTTTSKRTKILP